MVVVRNGTRSKARLNETVGGAVNGRVGASCFRVGEIVLGRPKESLSNWVVFGQEEQDFRGLSCRVVKGLDRKPGKASQNSGFLLKYH